MAVQVQFRRGTTAQNSTFTGAVGEVVVDTDLDILRVHDGVQVGGYALVGATATQTLTNKTLTQPTIDNIKLGYTTVATAAGTTTLTASSNYYQRFTGTSTQTIVLPVTSTLVTGIMYMIENASTGNLTVNSSGGNLVATVIPGVTMQFLCVGTSLTTAADWDAEYDEFATITGTGSVVLSASPTITGNLSTAGITPTANATSNIGNLAAFYNGVWAVTYNVGTGGIVNAGANATGNIGSSTTYFNTVFAKATSAQYADLAERYQADAEYAPGTVVVFGGTEEVTQSIKDHDTAIAGVVSTDPAYIMNATLQTPNSVAVALAGRVPCRVVGPVNKGTVLVTSNVPGTAQAIDYSKAQLGCVVGKAMQNIADTSVQTIEISVGRN